MTLTSCPACDPGPCFCPVWEKICRDPRNTFESGLAYGFLFGAVFGMILVFIMSVLVR